MFVLIDDIIAFQLLSISYLVMTLDLAVKAPQDSVICPLVGDISAEILQFENVSISGKISQETSVSGIMIIGL